MLLMCLTNAAAIIWCCLLLLPDVYAFHDAHIPIFMNFFENDKTTEDGPTLKSGTSSTASGSKNEKQTATKLLPLEPYPTEKTLELTKIRNPIGLTANLFIDTKGDLLQPKEFQGGIESTTTYTDSPEKTASLYHSANSQHDKELKTGDVSSKNGFETKTGVVDPLNTDSDVLGTGNSSEEGPGFVALSFKLIATLIGNVMRAFTLAGVQTPDSPSRANQQKVQTESSKSFELDQIPSRNLIKRDIPQQEKEFSDLNKVSKRENKQSKASENKSATHPTNLSTNKEHSNNHVNTEIEKSLGTVNNQKVYEDSKMEREEHTPDFSVSSFEKHDKIDSNVYEDYVISGFIKDILQEIETQEETQSVDTMFKTNTAEKKRRDILNSPKVSFVAPKQSHLEEKKIGNGRKEENLSYGNQYMDENQVALFFGGFDSIKNIDEEREFPDYNSGNSVKSLFFDLKSEDKYNSSGLISTGTIILIVGVVATINILTGVMWMAATYKYQMVKYGRARRENPITVYPSSSMA